MPGYCEPGTRCAVPARTKPRRKGNRTVGSNPTLSAIKPYLSMSYAIVSAAIPVPIYWAKIYRGGLLFGFGITRK